VIHDFSIRSKSKIISKSTTIKFCFCSPLKLKTLWNAFTLCIEEECQKHLTHLTLRVDVRWDLVDLRVEMVTALPDVIFVIAAQMVVIPPIQHADLDGGSQRQSYLTVISMLRDGVFHFNF